MLLQVGLLEVLVYEDDFRSSFTSSRTRKFSACFTTDCGNPGTLTSMSMSSHCVKKPSGCSETGPCSNRILRLRFYLRLYWSERLTDTGTQQENKSPCSFIGAFETKLDTSSISWALKSGGCSGKTSLPVLTVGFWKLVGFVGSLQNLHQLLNTTRSSSDVSKRSWKDAEVTHILSCIWFLPFPSERLWGCSKLGVFREEQTCLTELQ